MTSYGTYATYPKSIDEDRDLQFAQTQVPSAARLDSMRGSHQDLSEEVVHRPYFVGACFLANVAMFVISIWKNGWKFESFSDNPMFGPSPSVLLSLGAKQASLIRNGDWWRLFSPMFLHAGLFHLLMNMAVLLRLGASLERAFGAWRVACIYVMAGVSGIVASCLFLPQLISVGASGALYGLIGALFGDFVQNHRQMVSGKCSYITGLILSTALGLALGLLPLLDNFAHVFGFVCGLLAGLVFLAPRCGKCGPQHMRGYATSYTECVVAISVVLLMVWFASGFLFLYRYDNMSALCPWCKYLSCVETPWWSCDTTAMCRFTKTIGNSTQSYVAPCP